MNREIKQKLKQAAETAWEEDTRHNPNPCNPYAYVYGYKAGAQTILENPSEWGLCSIDQHAEYFGRLQHQRIKYSNALKRIADVSGILVDDWEVSAIKMYEIAKEALKQEEE